MISFYSAQWHLDSRFAFSLLFCTVNGRIIYELFSKKRIFNNEPPGFVHSNSFSWWSAYIVSRQSKGRCTAKRSISAEMLAEILVNSSIHNFWPLNPPCDSQTSMVYLPLAFHVISSDLVGFYSRPTLPTLPPLPPSLSLHWRSSRYKRESWFSQRKGHLSKNFKNLLIEWERRKGKPICALHTVQACEQALVINVSVRAFPRPRIILSLN